LATTIGGEKEMKLYTTILRVATAAAVAVGLTGFASPAEAEPSSQTGGVVTYENAVPGIAPPGDSAPYVDEHGRVIDLASERSSGGAMAPASSCQPVSLPDNPHYSGGDVSGHGQWEKGNCTSDQATVWNCLYEYYTDGTWRRKACSSKVTLKPKSLSNNRSTARRACDSTGQLISWRNHVDVDVHGQSDPSDKPYHQALVYCVVTGADQ
jgi:hypothetical protein